MTSSCIQPSGTIVVHWLKLYVPFTLYKQYHFCVCACIGCIRFRIYNNRTYTDVVSVRVPLNKIRQDGKNTGKVKDRFFLSSKRTADRIHHILYSFFTNNLYTTRERQYSLLSFTLRSICSCFEYCYLCCLFSSIRILQLISEKNRSLWMFASLALPMYPNLYVTHYNTNYY